MCPFLCWETSSIKRKKTTNHTPPKNKQTQTKKPNPNPPQKTTNLNHTWYTQDSKILMMQNFLDFFKFSPNCSQAKQLEEQLEAKCLQLGSR